MSSSQQPRREHAQPTYAAVPTSATTTTTTMYAPIAERAIPYEQYMSRDAEHIYSASRVTPRNAPRAAASTDDELRQFSREPTAMSLSSTVDGDVKTTTTPGGDGTRSERTQGAGSRSETTQDAGTRSERTRGDGPGSERTRSAGTRSERTQGAETRSGKTQGAGSGSERTRGAWTRSERTRQAGGEVLGAGMAGGFDSNTLKRMLQTLPELSTPVVDLMQEFEEEFADVVGPSTASRDDIKPPPASPPPPSGDDDRHTAVSTTTSAINVTTTATGSSASERHAGVTALMSSHVDANSSVHAMTSAPAEVVTSDVIKEQSADEGDVDRSAAEFDDAEEEITTAPVQLSHVAALTTTVTSSGKCHAS